MINRRTTIFISAIFLPSLLLFFNSCGLTGIGTSSSQNTTASLVIGTNPMADNVKASICSVLNRCNGVAMDACSNGVNQSVGIGTKLGLLSGAYDQFSRLRSAELGHEILANPIATNPCYSNIDALMCNDPAVTSAYDPSSSSPFANVAKMIPTAGACINTAWTPGVWQWAPITTSAGLTFTPGKQAFYPYAAILNSKLYFSWVEQDNSSNGKGAYNIRVAVYNGNDLGPAFKIVDGGTISGLNYNGLQDTVSTPHLVTFNGKLYAFWDETNGSVNQIRGKVYNGNDAAPSWKSIDTGRLNRLATADARVPQAGVANGKLYVAWNESNGTASQIRISVYNGNDSAPAWSLVDGGGSHGLNFNANKDAEGPTLLTFNSKLYMTWMEMGTPVSQIRMAVYNGNDAAPAWRFISGANGLNYDFQGKARNPRGVVFNNKIYLSWHEWWIGDDEEIRVATYNGDDDAPAWTFVDGGAQPSINWAANDKAQGPQLIVFNSQLINIWRESAAPQGSLGHVRAKIYNGNDVSPQWASIDGNSPLGLNFDPAVDIFYGWNHNPIPIVLNSKIYTIWEEDTRIHIKVGVPPH